MDGIGNKERVRRLAALSIGWLVSAASATMVGPDRILQCPEPERYIRQWSLLSFSTFGAAHWSDGYVDTQFVSLPPPIARCGSDGKYFWVAEAPVVATIHGAPGADLPRAVREAGRVEPAAAADYLAALAQGLARNRKEEVFLRRSAWWAANDALRRRAWDAAATTPFTEGSAARDNLERLVELLDPQDPIERILKAEGSRQLGRFDDASELLRGPFPAKVQDAVRQLGQWIVERDTLVRAFAAPGR